MLIFFYILINTKLKVIPLLFNMPEYQANSKPREVDLDLDTTCPTGTFDKR